MGYFGCWNSVAWPSVTRRPKSCDWVVIPSHWRRTPGESATKSVCSAPSAKVTRIAIASPAGLPSVVTGKAVTDLIGHFFPGGSG